MSHLSRLVDEHIRQMHERADAGTNPLRDGVRWREGEFTNDTLPAAPPLEKRAAEKEAK